MSTTCAVKDCGKASRISGDMCVMHDVERKHLENVVSLFAGRMRTRLLQKLKDGYSGWNNKACRDAVTIKLVQHVSNVRDGGVFDENDLVDVACLAMMLEVTRK